MDNVFHFNELEVIRIGNELIIPQIIDLELLRKYGFKKTEEYSPKYDEHIEVWVKTPEIKKKPRLK